MSILSGGDLLGWFNFDDIFKFTNNIDSAIYCFGIFEKVPKKHELPYTLKEVLYVGQTGGQEKTWDRKDKNTNRGRLQTTLHTRMKSHSSDKIKTIRFGQQGAKTAGKPKAGESARMKAKRKSFKARHAKNIKKGKMSAAYWANKVKW